MVSYRRIALCSLRRRPRQGLCFVVLWFACLAQSACTTSYPAGTRSISALSPLQLDDRQVSVSDVESRVSTPDLLALDESMQAFVQRYTGDLSGQRARLMTLHRAIKGPATLGLRYDPEADGTARDAFYRGTANCLTYASLFIALAREAGLEAVYQWLEVSPRWARDGERVTVRLHVNALVKIGSHEQFMVDIDPLESRDIAASRQITDADALALYHSNIAMKALAHGHSEEAWLQSVRALQLSPGAAHLWVNLGAIYRSSGQHADAEQSYLYALQLDSEAFSAMNNLAVLYEMEGRSEEQQYWEQRLAHYRDANPYYHAWLGDEAAKSGQWWQAVRNYERALALSPGDSRLLSALGQGYEELGQPQIAIDYLQRAIDTARTRSDSASYQAQLDALRGRD